MDLHDDSEPVVRFAQAQQDGRLILLGLFFAQALAGHRFLENLVDLLGGGGAEGDIVQAVVAGPAAHGLEEFQALHQGVHDFLCRIEAFLSDALCQLPDVLGKAFLLDVDGLVRAEGGADLHIDGLVGRDAPVPLQGIHGIVGGADEGHIRLLDDAAHGQVRIRPQLLVAEVPGLFGVFHRQGLVIAEELSQLQVAPMIHRVSDGHLQRLDKLEEALIIRPVSGDIILADPVGAHDAPFIVISEIAALRLLSAQPYLDQVVEAAVFVDFFRIDVAVVVHQRHMLCIVVKQVFGRLRLQQKIFVHKFFHCFSSVR